MISIYPSETGTHKKPFCLSRVANCQPPTPTSINTSKGSQNKSDLLMSSRVSITPSYCSSNSLILLLCLGRLAHKHIPSPPILIQLMLHRHLGQMRHDILDLRIRPTALRPTE